MFAEQEPCLLEWLELQGVQYAEDIQTDQVRKNTRRQAEEACPTGDEAQEGGVEVAGTLPGQVKEGVHCLFGDRWGPRILQTQVAGLKGLRARSRFDDESQSNRES